MTKDITRCALSIILMLGVIGMGGGLFYYNVPPTSREFLLIIITYLVSKGGTIYDFYFGSSQSSADQKAIIQNLTAPNGTAKPAP